MLRTAHLCLGASAGLCAAAIAGLGGVQAAALASAGGLAGILPDADIPAARLGVGTHRSGWTHSVVAAAALGCAAGIAPYLVGVPASIAAAAPALAGALHPLTDALSRAGAPLLWPLSGRRFGLPLQYDNPVVNGAAAVIALVAASWACRSIGWV